MKKAMVNDKPHLRLFAVKNREPGTEIDYFDAKSSWHKKMEFSDALDDSLENLMDETDDDSIKDLSSVQSDDEVVSKLRRTKSILVDRIPEFSDTLSDSSDDEIEGPSTSKFEMASQRLKRGRFRPLPMSLVGSDDSSVDSEEEYIPNAMEESSDSDCSLELPLESKKTNKFAPTNQSRCKLSSESGWTFSSQGSFESSQDSTQRDPDTRAEGNEDEIAQTYTDSEADSSMPLEKGASVFVNPVSKKKDGSRRYNKKHNCLYCGQVVQKMSRHLMRKHSDKVDVAKAFSCPKNSKERKQQLDFIRNKGNFQHNTEVLESRKGKLIPCKQPKEKTEGQNFLHCVYCYGLFTRRMMWRHFQVCKFNPQGKTSKPGKTRVQALCAFAEPAPTGFSDAYWKFLNDMIQDNIAIAVKQDECILDYGYRLFKKNERAIRQHQHIRQRLRELGRLLLAAKKVTPVKTFRELIKPEKYNHVVTAARYLAGLSDETDKYQRPSLARKVGHSLHSLALFIKSEGMKMKDKETVRDAEEFAQLYQESWKFDMVSQVPAQVDQSKWNSPQLLPFTQDVQNLHSYLSEKRQQHFNALKEEVSPLNWKNLAEVTLAQVILFNRQREEEVSRMLVSAYSSRDAPETHEDVNLALTALEQKLCRHFIRVTLVGKRGRKVPILLTTPMKESLDTLIEKREECGVLNENGFLFALPHSVDYLRGSDCVRQFVHQCDGVKNPKALTSTKLRKHIATVTTVLNLKPPELDQMADFLGQNIDVHRKQYCLPERTLQLAKISKVLLALEQGRQGEYKGKSLDEIHIDPNETVDMEGCSQEDMEDASLPEAKGPGDDSSVPSLQECTSTVDVLYQRKSAKKREAKGPGDDVRVTTLQECTSTAGVPNQRKTAKKRGKKTAVKRSWTSEECAAVERHLRKCIVMNQVPGKKECQRCITEEPQALASRDWKAVKYFIKNRITALRRKLQ
ncbi:uncharacterized protein [Pempheris klunzingeri]|uniref:uncharacterized protein isoform X2 n=1 Tax=Pempheris klunzingeri TaxID=3127111 RepID=UPI00397F987C